MTITLFHPAFSGGETDTMLRGRVDTEQYALSVEKMENYSVSPLGTAISRPGLEYIETAFSGNCRLVPFQYLVDAEDTYLLLFSDLTLHFIQNGAFVTSGGSPYSIVTPYTSADIPNLKFSQDGNRLEITLNTRRPRNLVRSAHASWTLSVSQRGSTVSAPTNLTSTPSGAGSSGAAFAVTAVDSEGRESIASEYVLEELSINYTATAGSCTLDWDDVAEADFYRVYRSVFHDFGNQLTRSVELGYLGLAYGPTFTDTNITPDFTASPPLASDPFANGAITKVSITAAGASYAKTDSVVITDPDGSGFEGYPIINSAGNILGVAITQAGSGYTAPVVSFTTSTGAGATATATVGASSGNNPTCATIFQQRQVYGGTKNQPNRIDASRIDDLDNFDAALNVSAADAYSYTLDVKIGASITSMLPSDGGLLLFNEANVALLSGTQGAAVSGASSPVAPVIATPGSAFLTPLVVEQSILYLAPTKDRVSRLLYDSFRRSYGNADVSAFVRKMLKQELVAWAWAASPDSIVWCVTAAGRALSLSYHEQEKVYAWAQHKTAGRFLDVAVVREGGKDRVYFLVERYVGGAWVKFVERLALRDFDTDEDSFCVDAGLSLPHDTPGGTLYPAAGSGTGVVVDLVDATFPASITGDTIYMGSAKADVVSRPSTTRIIVDFIDPIDEDGLTYYGRPIAITDWSHVTPTATVSGLGHLEGREVVALGDGQVYDGLTVSSGAVTLPQAASKICVGLKYECRIRTFPIYVEQLRSHLALKAIKEAGVLVEQSRGLEMRSDPRSGFQPIFDRGLEAWSAPTGLTTGILSQGLSSGYAEETRLEVRSTQPLPSHILALALVCDIGKRDTG